MKRPAPYRLILLLVRAVVVSAATLGAQVQADTTVEKNRRAFALYQLADDQLFSGLYSDAITTARAALELAPDHDMFIDVDRQTNIAVIRRGRRLESTSTEKVRRELYRPTYVMDAATALLERRHECAQSRSLVLIWRSLNEPTGDRVLDGGETAEVVLTVENRGETDARDVLLRTATDFDAGVEFEPRINLGNISALNSVTTTLRIKARKDITAATRSFNWVADEPCGYDSNTVDMVLNTQPAGEPYLTIERLELVENGTNVKPETVAHARAIIRNSGHGVAEHVRATVLYGDNVFPAMDSAVFFEVDALFPNESREFTFAFVTNNRIEAGQLVPVKLRVESPDMHSRVEMALNEAIIATPSRRTISIARARESAGTSPTDFNISTLAPPKNSTARNPDAVALIIGNRDYSTMGLPDVEYAIRDANAVRAHAIATFGVEPHNVLFYTDVTLARLNELFGTPGNPEGKLFSYVTPGVSDVFIYYSGHGAPNLKNQGAYFVPVDADPARIEFSGYALDVMYRNLSRLPARSVTLVLDACFSGNSAGGPLLKQISATTSAVNTSPAPLSNMTIFTSTSAGEVSTWLPDQQHGLFTYYFLRGLSGPGDRDGDGVIAASELQDYLSRTVPFHARRLSGHKQTPRLIQRADRVLLTYYPVSSPR